MSRESRRTLVTAALPYANGPLHIGHIAGAYLPADIYCRYLRLMARDVLFICGSDEHGVPILLRAKQEGVAPQAVVDRYHAHMKATFESFGMSFDFYGRTSSPTHHETSREFFRTLSRKGEFVLRSEAQLYDPEAKMFLADRFVRGTCPACGYDDAYGDQCEKCGRSLSPAELVNPRSALSSAVPVEKETTHWYLPLGKRQKELEAWIAGHAEWKPNVLGQVRSWFQDGLADRAVTRDLPWGVPVPEDVAKAAGIDVTGKVLYVWFDAPIGYVSATREWAKARGEPEAWKRWWQDETSKLVHFIGKDNIVFHCLIFPAMLRAHGDYVLPDNVPANEFLNLEGKKLSTSRGWAVWLHEALAAFPADYLRYSLCVTLPETRDADFAWKDFQGHVNHELADTVGNLVNRTATFACRYLDGHVPALDRPAAEDGAALAALAPLPEKAGALIEEFRFRDALFEVMAVARLANKYLNDREPWRTRQQDPRTCGNTIHVGLQVCASLSIVLEPFLPQVAARLRAMLRLEGLRSSTPQAAAGARLGWSDAGRALLPAGHRLGDPAILVPKVEDAAIAAQLAKLQATPAPASTPKETPKEATMSPQSPPPGPAYVPQGAPIDYEDFAKVDLRTGVVLAAERVEKSKKLLRCEVDLGFEKRQILAGVAERLKPEDLIGRRVVVVANLKPRKMMGMESQGMLLMAETPDGGFAPLSAESPPGAIVK